MLRKKLRTHSEVGSVLDSEESQTYTAFEGSEGRGLTPCFPHRKLLGLK
ncbi:hypothetical protein LEMLEM_LOCUS15997 [Lemmus lemmus]